MTSLHTLQGRITVNASDRAATKTLLAATMAANTAACAPRSPAPSSFRLLRILFTQLHQPSTTTPAQTTALNKLIIHATPAFATASTATAQAAAPTRLIAQGLPIRTHIVPMPSKAPHAIPSRVIRHPKDYAARLPKAIMLPTTQTKIALITVQTSAIWMCRTAVAVKRLVLIMMTTK